MTKNITINSTNNIGLNNNTYVYNFKQGNYEIEDNDTLHIGNMILPNSVANVAPQYNNNQFAYIMAGLNTYIGGLNISFTANGSFTNTNIINISNVINFVYIGYVISFTGVNTTNPIYVTDVNYTNYSPVRITLTLNQNISVTNGTAGIGYIVGNKILTYPALYYANPISNLYLPISAFSSANNSYNLFTYITSVSTYASDYVGGLFLLTLNVSIPYSALVRCLIGGEYDQYINWVNLSTGYYDVPALNNALHNTMYNNGHYYFRNASGSNSSTIFYPQSLVNDTKRYGVNQTNSETQPVLYSNISTIYGTNATFNNIIIQNGNFNLAPLPTNSISASYATFTTGNIFPFWNATGSYAGNTEWYLGNGINSFVSVAPSSGSNYASISLSTTSIGICNIENYFNLDVGTYNFSFKCYMLYTDATPQVTLNINATNFNFTPVYNTWTTFTGSITILTTSSYTLRITPALPVTAVGGFQVYSFTDFTFTNANTSLQSIGNYWVNGFGDNLTNTLCNVYLNLNQTTGTYVKNPDNYSLGYMTLNSKSLSIIAPSTALYTMPYGLGMNFINGAIIRCNLVDNSLYTLTDILDALPFIYPFGSNTTYNGDERNLIKLRRGRYNNITFQICDQNGNPLILLDNNVLMNFIISKRNI